jgi:hypothetical protein
MGYVRFIVVPVAGGARDNKLKKMAHSIIMYIQMQNLQQMDKTYGLLSWRHCNL